MKNEVETFEPIRNWETFWMNSYIQSLLKGQLGKCRTGILKPKGGTPDFKWKGYQNGGKNQSPTKSLGLPTKSLDQDLAPQKSHAKFLSHKNFQKALDDITRKIETLALNTQKILAKIFLPKKSRNWKFQTPKNPSIIPVTQNLAYPLIYLTNQKPSAFVSIQ